MKGNGLSRKGFQCFGRSRLGRVSGLAIRATFRRFASLSGRTAVGFRTVTV